MIIDLNMNQPTGGLIGTHLWTVDSATFGKSRKGDSMLTLKLSCLPNDRNEAATMSDIIMLQGPGFGIGKPKLVALGVKPNHSGPFDPLDLHGRRVWISTVEQQWEHEGKSGSRIAVDITQLSHKGYQPEDNVPPGCDPMDYTQPTPF